MSNPTDDRFFRYNNRLIEGEDYYLEDGYRVLTRSFLVKRGYCCANGCRHCPYWPKHTKGNTHLDEDQKE